MWLLRTQTMLREEMCMEGVPTQDMLVLMEMDKSDRLEMNLVGNDRSNPSTASQLANLKWIAEEVGEDLKSLIYAIITGGQIIVRTNDRSLSKLFLLALTHLLPMGCIRFLSSSISYYESTKYNFLGLKLAAAIPRDLETEPFVVRLVPPCSKSDHEIKLLDCELLVEDAPPVPIRAPVLIHRFRQLLKDYSLSTNVLDATLRATREEWLSKAKLVYQVSRQKERIDMDAVIKIIKCGAQDRCVLNFWQSGLSKVYKQQVIDTINNS